MSTEGRMLAAVAGRRGLVPLSVELGMSTPALVQRAVWLARQPGVAARWPRECRIINERREKVAAQPRMELP